MNDGSDPKNPITGNDGVPGPGPNSQAAKAGANWEMPAPIFRVSEGVEVKKPAPDAPAEANGDGAVSDEALAKLYAPPESELDTGEAKVEAAPAAPPAVEIQPQPYISEEFTLNDIPETIPPEKKGDPTMRKVMAGFGLFCMVLFIIAFIGVVYFLFFYKSDAGTF